MDRDLAHATADAGKPHEIPGDLKARRFAEHTLQLAIQAALDIVSHIVSDLRLGEPRTNRELFDLLGTSGWIPPGLVTPLKSMAGFRNILVHGYLETDPRIVADVVANHLGDLDRFVDSVRTRLG